MPFTPLHFGPSAALGYCFKKHIDWGALLLANVAVDLEPLVNSHFRLDAPEHGLTHSFLGGSGVAVVWALLYFTAKKILSIIREWRNIIFSSFLGVYSNILIDAIAYEEIMLFFPLTINPFYGLLSESILTGICGAITAVWLVMVFKGKVK